MSRPADPTGACPLPLTADGITAEWLSAALRTRYLRLKVASRPAPCLPMSTSDRKPFAQASRSLPSTAIAYRMGSCRMARRASMRSTRSASPSRT